MTELYLDVTDECIQVAGEPLDQNVVQYGPFVMTSREEVQKTLIDCKLIDCLAIQFPF